MKQYKIFKNGQNVGSRNKKSFKKYLEMILTFTIICSQPISLQVTMRTEEEVYVFLTNNIDQLKK